MRKQNWYVWNGSGKNRLFNYQQKVKSPPVKAYRGSKATVPLVLNLILDAGEWPFHTLATLRQRYNTGIHCTGGWVGSRTGLDSFGEEKISFKFKFNIHRSLHRNTFLFYNQQDAPVISNYLFL
jgi:hypothetical protein